MAIAPQVVRALEEASSPADVANVARFFRGNDAGRAPDNRIMGVRFGKIFAIAKRHAAATLVDLDRLLDSPYYEVRMAAVSIMDVQARTKTIAPPHQKALFDLYLRRHDRINNWDLVDRAAPHVVGRYLADRSRRVLYRLARSKNPWERRTAIVSTWYLIKSGDIEDTFGIAALLVADRHELVQKAVGSWLREAGKRDLPRLQRFVDEYGHRMTAATRRAATERLSRSRAAG